MTKRLIDNQDGALFHVMTRTVQQMFLLVDPDLKQEFVNLIDFYGQVYYVDVFAHVVMSNHWHLAIRVNRPEMDEDDVRRRYELSKQRLANKRQWQPHMAQRLHKRYTSLSWFMWEINRRLSVFYNKKHKTKGHLWAERFKSVNVEKERLLDVMAYIELNPVRANMVTDPAAFEFSSVGRIAARLSRGETPTVPAVDFLAEVPECLRAQYYLAWIRSVTDDKQNPESVPQASAWRHLDMKALRKALAEKAPAQWNTEVYGTTTYQTKLYIQTGRFIPLQPRRKKEVAQPGQSLPGQAA